MPLKHVHPPPPPQSRARLSFKRRPPTRQHRRSGGEEDGFELALSPCELYRPTENGEGEQSLASPAEDACIPEAKDKDKDCAQMQDEVEKADEKDLEEEQEEEQTQNLKTIEEEQASDPSPTEGTGGVEEREAEMVGGEHQADNCQM